MISWLQCKNLLQKEGQDTLNTIKKNSGIPYEATVERKFLSSTLLRFSQSENSLLLLSAPSSYGKSIMLAHWVEDAWADSQDCIAFVQGSQLFSLYKSDGKIDLTTGEYKMADLLEYYDKSKDERFGKFFIVIDGVSYATALREEGKEVYQLLLSSIEHVFQYDWVKVVMGVHILDEETIINPLIQSLQRKDVVHELPPTWEGRGGNIPLMDEQEVSQVIEKFDEYSATPSYRSEEYLLLTDHMKEVLRQPFFLEVFLNTHKPSVEEEHFELFLLQYVLRYKIEKENFKQEKVQIIRYFIECIADKPELEHIYTTQMEVDAHGWQNGYRELIKDGILIEARLDSDGIGLGTKVSMANPQLLALLLAQYYIEQQGGISFEMVNKVCLQYKKSHILTDLLICFIHLAFWSESYEFLARIFDIEYPFQKVDYTDRVVLPVLVAIGMHIRSSAGARDALYKVYAVHPKGQSLFFEFFVDVDYLVLHHFEGIQLYRQHKKTQEAQLFSNCMLFLKAFLTMDKRTVENQIKKVSAIEIDEFIHPIPAGRKMAYTILYEKYYRKDISPETIDKIARVQQKMPRSGELSREIPFFNVYVAEAFNWCGDHKRALALIEEALELYPSDNINYLSQSFINRILLQQAWALSKIGEEEKALSSFYQVRPYHFDVFSRQFDLMNYYIVESFIWKIEQEPMISELCINKARNIAYNHNFLFFSEVLIPELAE